MGTDPLAIAALVMCCAVWLLTAAFLALELLGRLPGARKRNARAFRIQQTAGLVLMTAAVLVQVADLEHWARPVREAITILSILAGIGTMAAVIKAAAIQSRGARTRLAPETSHPVSPAGPARNK